MHNEKLPAVPIEHFVVMANQLTYIKTEKENRDILKTVIHAEKIIDRLLEAKNQYQKQLLYPHQIKEINKRLLVKHTPSNKKILEIYGIAEKELIRGVQCNSCNSFNIKRKNRKWHALYVKTFPTLLIDKPSMTISFLLTIKYRIRVAASSLILIPGT